MYNINYNRHTKDRKLIKAYFLLYHSLTEYKYGSVLSKKIKNHFNKIIIRPNDNNHDEDDPSSWTMYTHTKK